MELRLYLAQAYVAGESLLQRREEHRVNEAEALDIARQVLEILVALHGHTPRILHCDIKPANLLRRPDGQLFLVDFGAARGLERGATHRNTLVGTFGYMPPEQLGGTVDETSDLYELGATLLHWLRRLRVRDERRDDIHFALLVLGCDLMLFKSLSRFCRALQAHIGDDQ